MSDSEFKADVIGRTAAQWSALDPFLSKNDLGVETDTGRKKIGVGQRWSATPYAERQGVSGVIEFTADGLNSVTIENGIITNWFQS